MSESPGWLWNASGIGSKYTCTNLQGKGHVMNCISNGAVELHAHETKVVKKVLEKRLRRIVTVDEIQFGFIPEKGTIDVFVYLEMAQEEYDAKGIEMYMCLLYLEKAFDRVPRNVLS